MRRNVHQKSEQKIWPRYLLNAIRKILPPAKWPVHKLTWPWVGLSENCPVSDEINKHQHIWQAVNSLALSVAVVSDLCCTGWLYPGSTCNLVLLAANCRFFGSRSWAAGCDDVLGNDSASLVNPCTNNLYSQHQCLIQDSHLPYVHIYALYVSLGNIVQYGDLFFCLRSVEIINFMTGNVSS